MPFEQLHRLETEGSSAAGKIETTGFHRIDHHRPKNKGTDPLPNQYLYFLQRFYPILVNFPTLILGHCFLRLLFSDHHYHPRLQSPQNLQKFVTTHFLSLFEVIPVADGWV